MKDKKKFDEEKDRHYDDYYYQNEDKDNDYFKHHGYEKD